MNCWGVVAVCVFRVLEGKSIFDFFKFDRHDGRVLCVFKRGIKGVPAPLRPQAYLSTEKNGGRYGGIPMKASVQLLS